MATVKLTFSLDAATVSRLRTAAERLRMPQSQVVREAVAEYSSRIGRLSEAERAAMLRTFDRLVPALPSRPVAQVEAELRALRAARRRAGRRRSDRR
jgi:predicted transcriptional regulator